MTEKFKINLIGILFDPKKRKILVGKNFGDTSYSFLDGELKYNEELDKGLKKVAFEKTGYKVHNLGVVYAENMLRNKEELNIYFLCEATEGKEKKGKNVEDLKWVLPKNVEKELGIKLPTRLKEYILNLA